MFYTSVQVEFSKRHLIGVTVGIESKPVEMGISKGGMVWVISLKKFTEI